MKKLFFFLHFTFYILHSHAQREYWGMTTTGGKYFDSATFKYGGGVIFKTDKKSKNYQVIYNFDSATGIEPHGSLIKADNGKLYGISSSLSSTMFTCLFEFNPITRVYKVLMKADTLAGGGLYRRGTPFQATNGKIYSLCGNKLVETDDITGTNNVIANALSTASGENYFMQASNGKVYFVTINTNFQVGQHGALYELDLTTKAVTLRHQFWDQTGSQSFGSPVEWSPGILYGTFSTGADSSTERGGIYSYNLNTGVYEMKQTFYNVGITTGTKSISYGGLTRFGNKMYGAVLSNGLFDKGFLYSYEPATNTLDTLVNFASTYWHPLPPYDSLRSTYYYPSNGYGTELRASYDNKLYGLSANSMFSYNPMDSEFRSLNYLGVGSTQFSGSLGYSPTYARLLETCTPPYHFTAIPDTIHVLQNNPFSITISTPNTDTFHWVKDIATPLPQQTDSTLHFDTARLSDEGWYTCTLVNECGDSILKKFYLKVDIITPLGLTFTGKLQNNNALLQWHDETANNVSNYELQRSITANNFAPITQIPAQQNQYNYTYTDKNFADAPTEGKAFYRLKQVSKDGKEAYSNIVLLTINNPQFTITPNPAKDKVTITFNSRVSGNVRFDFYAANGQLLQTNQSNSTTTETINVSHLPTGIYTLKITTPESVQTKKLIIER